MARKPTKPPSEDAGTVKLTTPTVVPVVPATIVEGAVQISTQSMIKKPEFIERAMARTTIKKRDAKPAIEAALAELADLLADGNDLNLPPMGKLKLVKSKDIGDGAKVLTLKLRTMKDTAGQPKDAPDGD